MGIKGVGIFLLNLIASVLFSSHAEAECAVGKTVSGEYLVRVAETTTDVKALGKMYRNNTLQLLKGISAKLKVIHKQPAVEPFAFGAKASHKNPLPTIAHVKINNDDLAFVESLDGVLSVEPNCYVDLFAQPNDFRYSEQWAHQVMESEKAWDISTGSYEVIVAVSDTGVDYNHEDLRAQMWVNEAEQNGQAGVDDDSNGCIDDIYGCDTADKDGDPSPGRLPSSDHGTHVAGIVGAVGNNSQGIVGINWKIKLMAAKGFFDNQDSTTSAALLDSVTYAVDNGAKVINCSWGSNSSPTEADLDVFQYAKDNGVVTVVAAGNSSRNSRDFSPAAIPHTITVAASNAVDSLASFSNFGKIVDLMAPGGDIAQLGGRDDTIISTVPGNRYEGKVGTSMAAPYVAGLAALVLSINKDLDPDTVEQILKDSADQVTVSVPTQSNLTYDYLRINAFKAALAAKATLPDLDEDDDENCDPGSQNCKAGGTPNISGSVADAVLSGSGCGKMRAERSQSSSASRNIWWALLLLPFSVLITKRSNS